MATLGAGYSFGATETVTAAKLASLVNSGTVSSIVNADVDASAAIANSKLNLSSVTQSVAMSGGLTLSGTGLTLTSVIGKFAKGADVASVAGNIALGDDGNYFDITGTNAITSITAKTAGTVVILQFDSTASLVDGSNLKLQGNFSGTAEAQICLVSDGTNWFEVCRNTSSFTPSTSNALSGSVIQSVYTSSGTASSAITTQIPSDNTIPQNTEGVEVLSLAITPSNASNYLMIEAVINYGQSSGPTDGVIAALFQDSTANALAACWDAHASSYPGQIVLKYRMTAGTTSSTTFKIRLGPDAAITVYFNADGSGNAVFNGVMASTLSIQEIKA